MKSNLILALVLLPLCGTAQQKKLSFSIGESHSAAWASLGAPNSFFAADEHYKNVPRFARGLVWEAYDRRAAGRIYEARVLYEIDPDSSRLHPSSRIQEVRFVFDRPISARVALAAVPEVAAVCADSCYAYAYDEPGAPHLKVKPTRPFDGRPILELSWIAADGIKEHVVEKLDDPVTEIWMYARPSDDGDAGDGAVGTWPEKRP